MLRLCRLKPLKELFAFPSVLSTAPQRSVAKMTVTEGEKETVIEAVPIESDRKHRLINLDNVEYKDALGAPLKTCPSKNCHPLCRLPFVHKIKHTDVLILRQFMRDDGHIMMQSDIEICDRQYFRLGKLIKMAQKAGLFPEPLDIYAEEKTKVKYTKQNSYYDEKTIDKQWLNVQERKKRYTDLKHPS